MRSITNKGIIASCYQRAEGLPYIPFYLAFSPIPATQCLQWDKTDRMLSNPIHNLHNINNTPLYHQLLH